MRRKNIFVLGMDPLNHARLERLPDADRLTFHPLFTYRQVQGADAYPADYLLHECQRRLDAFEGPIDGIIGCWDFPVTDLIPILGARYNVPAALLESVLKCEHKYWSRLEQARVVPEHVPAFQAVDPKDPQAAARVGVGYPCWIKPIKSFSSYLGFRVEDERGMQQVLRTIAQRMTDISDGFDSLLEHATLPEPVRAVDGGHCIVEELIAGHQCTVEGYVVDGEVAVHGVIDSVRYPGWSSFARYQYPSCLPEHVQAQLIRISHRLVRHLGLNHTAFNIEYFYDAARDHAWLLEINPRISQSHSEMFRMVDGVSNHRIVVDLALGEPVCWEPGRGSCRVAAKLFVRRFGDARVLAVPGPQRLRWLMERVGHCTITMQVSEGTQLSQLYGQDSYSYELAHIHLGGEDEGQILERYRWIAERLGLMFREPNGLVTGLDERTLYQPLSAGMSAEVPESLAG